MLQLPRRNFLLGLFAPAIIPAGILMPVKLWRSGYMIRILSTNGPGPYKVGDLVNVDDSWFGPWGPPRAADFFERRQGGIVHLGSMVPPHVTDPTSYLLYECGGLSYSYEVERA